MSNDERVHQPVFGPWQAEKTPRCQPLRQTQCLRRRGRSEKGGYNTYNCILTPEGNSRAWFHPLFRNLTTVLNSAKARGISLVGTQQPKSPNKNCKSGAAWIF